MITCAHTCMWAYFVLFIRIELNKIRDIIFQHTASLLHAYMPVFLFFFPSRAIVFVVDSAAFQREVKDVAEFLYQVLLDSIGLKNTPSFLIACNKQGTIMFSSNNSWDFSGIPTKN